jgi:hypothetical protein
MTKLVRGKASVKKAAKSAKESAKIAAQKTEAAERRSRKTIEAFTDAGLAQFARIRDGLPANVPDSIALGFAETARRLHELTDGRIKVQYAPGEQFDIDRSSQGYLFDAQWDLFNDNDIHIIGLDAREGDLHLQLATHLERIAKEYASVARDIRAKAKRGQVHSSLIKPFKRKFN